MIYAHSRAGHPLETWEPLGAHLEAVANRAAAFAAVFGWAELARAAGLLHDIGKNSEAFQRYIQGLVGARGPDHSTAGAREAEKRYGAALGRLLSYVVAGHHAGLADWPDLERRLAPDYAVPPCSGWEAASGALPDIAGLRPTMVWKASADNPGFSSAFLTRMLFSCLVDADFLETERFYDEAQTQVRGGYSSVPELRERLRGHMAAVGRSAASTPVNALRARILSHAVGKAADAPGFFTLTVPTGGGKTLASLAFALEHAAQHGLRRVVYVIPFTGARIETLIVAVLFALDTMSPTSLPHGGADRNGASPPGSGASSCRSLTGARIETIP